MINTNRLWSVYTWEYRKTYNTYNGFWYKMNNRKHTQAMINTDYINPEVKKTRMSQSLT